MTQSGLESSKVRLLEQKRKVLEAAFLIKRERLSSNLDCGLQLNTVWTPLKQPCAPKTTNLDLNWSPPILIDHPYQLNLFQFCLYTLLNLALMVCAAVLAFTQLMKTHGFDINVRRVLRKFSNHLICSDEPIQCYQCIILVHALKRLFLVVNTCIAYC